MTKLEKLEEQFKKENAFWKQEVKKCEECIDVAMKAAVLSKDNVERWAVFINIAADYKLRMMDLDKKYKRFLLKWKKKSNRALLLRKLTTESMETWSFAFNSQKKPWL